MKTFDAGRAFSLAGKAALVTGGNGGIGLGMAKGLAQAGAPVAIAGRKEKKNADAVRQLEAFSVKAIALKADVEDEKGCRAMVDQAARELGRLDILVTNAGMNIRKAPQDLALEDWKKVMDTNLTSAFVASQAVYPHLKRAGGGKIINIGSMMSIFAAAYLAPYAASKAGVVQLTKALACAWAKDNIQVNAVLPGWIDTALTQKARVELTGLNERVQSRPPAAGAPAAPPRRGFRLLQRGLNSFGDEAKLRAALHPERLARVMRQHEDRRVIRRLVAPPALPALIGPRPADGTEHVAPKDPGADSGKALLRDAVVDSRLALALAVHVAPQARMEKPFHQLRAPDAERILQILIRPGAVAVDGKPEALHAQFRHQSLVSRYP